MPVKRLKHPTLDRTVCFGRRISDIEYPRLSLKNYVMKGLPSPPSSVDYSPAAMPALNNIYGNDQLGDCVIAASAHIVGVLTGNAGSCVTFTDQQIVSRYSAVGGYVPGDSSTDDGCSMVHMLASWIYSGMMPLHKPPAKHKIVGYLAVDPNNVEEMKTALWLFANLDIGMSLPDAWVDPFPSSSGFTWDKAGPPDWQNGHNVAGFGYSSTGVLFDTWALLGTLTWAAMAEYCASINGGELYSVLSQDIINKAKQVAPTGFAFSQLLTDLESLGSVVF